MRGRVLVRPEPVTRLWTPNRRVWMDDLAADRDDPALRRVMARQLRLGLTVCAGVAAVLIVLPVIVAVVPMPVWARWLLPVAGVPPVWGGLTWWYLRRIEKAEA